MKHNFAMLCKTYIGDLERFKTLLKSFNTYNRDNIHLYVSCPETDLEFFSVFKQDNIRIISDESYAKNYFADAKNFELPIGYVNQEICKLSFWEAGFCNNYLCLDSDAEFIRDFYVSDFMADENTPYTVLVQDKDLSMEKHYQEFWVWRQSLIQKIYDEVELDDKRLRTCHGMQVMNETVLKSLKEDFMKPKDFEYKNLLEISPYEFTWYNAWFQKCELVKEMAVEPFFKTFHMRIDYIFSRFKLIDKSDLAKAYLGIILNGNWHRPAKEYLQPTKFHKWTYYTIFNDYVYVRIYRFIIKFLSCFIPIRKWRKAFRKKYLP